MSRTIRRKGVKTKYYFNTIEEHDDYWNKFYFIRHWYKSTKSDLEVRRSLMWKWHNDSCCWMGRARSKAREDTKHMRRAYDKKIRHELMKDTDYDYYDRHKQYLGIIWIYD